MKASQTMSHGFIRKEAKVRKGRVRVRAMEMLILGERERQKNSWMNYSASADHGCRFVRISFLTEVALSTPALHKVRFWTEAMAEASVTSNTSGERSPESRPLSSSRHVFKRHSAPRLKRLCPTFTIA